MLRVPKRDEKKAPEEGAELVHKVIEDSLP